MLTKFDKILNPWTLLALNAVIIVVTELSGSGFMRNGVIHLIAICFVILGISRVFVHYDTYDDYLRPLIKGSVLALLIFSTSHLIEFLGLLIFKGYSNQIFSNVVNFYILSMLMVAIGAEYFLRAKSKSSLMISALFAAMAVFFCLTVLIFLKKVSISLDPGGSTVYIYTVAVLGAYFLSVSRLYQIGRTVSIIRGFTSYHLAAFTLVAIGALEFVLNVVLGDIGFPFLQILYTSHFLFYAAMSLMFLAFARLASLGGIYSKLKH